MSNQSTAKTRLSWLAVFGSRVSALVSATAALAHATPPMLIVPTNGRSADDEPAMVR
jgi:hypothetical protein